MGSLSFTTPQCSNGCQVKLSDVEDCWLASVPTSTGLYRYSCDIKVARSAEKCTESNVEKAMSNAAQLPPVCNGTHGEVNGKPVCLAGTGDLNVMQSTPGVLRGGNPAAGPVAAGATPSTRTPTGGNGGNAGGPQASGGGTGGGVLSGDGTTNKPGEGKEQQECGAPGQPQCRIDESGTPNGSGSTSQEGLNAAWQSAEAALTSVSSSQGKDTTWSMPSWFLAAQCQPWDLGTLPIIDVAISVNICPVKPYIDGAANFVWIVFGFFGTLAMVFNVTTQSKAA